MCTKGSRIQITDQTLQAKHTYLLSYIRTQPSMFSLLGLINTIHTDIVVCQVPTTIVRSARKTYCEEHSKQHVSWGHYGESTAKAAPGRGGREKQGVTRWGNNASRAGLDPPTKSFTAQNLGGK